MNSGYCQECHTYSYTLDSHKCPPRFEFIQPDYGDDWDDDGRTVHAIDAKRAAEKAAERICDSSCEYSTVSNLHVRKRGETEIFIFDVYVESVPVYAAVSVRQEQPC